MVNGFDSFRTHFAGYEDCYTIIGGTACDILMTEVDLPFRATKDVDMILLIENRFPDFAKLFWEYIKAGGYRCWQKNGEAPHFYRFTEPKPGFPVMIELFSRRPDFQLENADSHLTPLPISDEVSSLSAIMLDDDYYNLMLTGRTVVDGISVLRSELLIVFKAKAWLDLTARKANGEFVNDRDLRKHRGDVFRLYAIVDPESRIDLPSKVQGELESFLNRMQNEPLDLRQYGLDRITLPQVLESLKRIFGITE